MMRMSRKCLNARTAEGYYTESESVHFDEYFTEKNKITGVWFGKGAEMLGFGGDVEKQDFAALVRRIDPRTGQQFIAGGNGIHRAGWDCVFSAPKSVSIMALAGGDGRLIDAHKRAVAATLPDIEKYAMTHVRVQGSQYVVSANLVGASFQHYTARPPSSGDVDPHLIRTTFCST
jgi:conjugative relaxase-like TrwC/TraI family protein